MLGSHLTSFGCCVVKLFWSFLDFEALQLNPFNTIWSSSLPWPNLIPLHTLEAHNSAGHWFTSLKPSAFNRKLNFEKNQLFVFVGFPPDPPPPHRRLTEQSSVNLSVKNSSIFAFSIFGHIKASLIASYGA